MKIIERIKNHLTNAFNKMLNKNTIKFIEATNEEKKVLRNNTYNEKENFKNSLRVNGKTTNKSINSFLSDSYPIIETLQCINDGLGFQKINK